MPKTPIKVIELICSRCSSHFTRTLSASNKNTKRGSLQFCSRSCAASAKNAIRYHGVGSRDLSENGSFLFYVHKARDVSPHECSVDASYLKELWHTQQGKCAYTGIPLKLITRKISSIKTGITAASLDRIDSSKGYLKGNVQFVALGLNYAKNSFTDLQARQFVEEIRNTEPIYIKSGLSQYVENLVRL